MNSKKLVILAVILVVAVGLIVTVNTVSNRAPAEKSLKFFPGISEKNIGAVVLKDALDRVKIQRKGDVWVMVPNAVLSSSESPATAKKASGLDKVMATDSAAVPLKAPAGLAAAEFPADSGTVAQLMENIVRIKKDIQISENPAKQADFEVTADRGNRIEVFDLAGKSLGAVILGKAGSEYSSCYLRPENSSAVYRVNDCNRWAFGTDHKRWTDKSLLRFDRTTIRQLSFAEKAGPVLVLEKSSDTAAPGWRMLKPVAAGVREIDTNKVNEVIGMLSYLNAQEIEDSAYTHADAGLTAPSIVATISLASGTTRSLAVGSMKPGTPGKYWARVPEKQLLYLIGENEFKMLSRKPAEFRNAAPAPVKTSPAK